MSNQLLLLIAVVLVLAPLPASLAQDGDAPTIAFLRYGPMDTQDLTEKAILDMLQAHGFLNDEERGLLDERRDLEGDNINIIWGHAGFDLPAVNIMVEEAIDKGADILHTLTTPVSQIAANITREMDRPPALFFSIVTTPYDSGIADSPCIKPAHIVGTHSPIPYDLIVPLLFAQDPDITMLGTLVNPAEASSVYGSNKIIEHAEALGLTVEIASVASPSDLAIATEALADKGVEAIMIAASYLEGLGLPSIVGVASENGIPVFGPIPGMVISGTVISAGFNEFYRDGIHTARMMIGYLNGDIDIADVGIVSTPSLTVALNLDTADEAGIDVSAELRAMAEWVIEDGVNTEDQTPPELAALTLDERKAEDAAFLESISCTEERIAAERAQLAGE